MKLIHIVGRKNHGKTTFVTELVRELTRRQLRVGTIKHSSHDHELDTPGKDSYHHRQAGASPAAVVTNGLTAVYIPRNGGPDAYEHLAPVFAGCDLVLVEGHLDCPGIKIEVWREVAGDSCLAIQRDDIAAVVTDDRLEIQIPVLPRADVERAAEYILALLDRKP